MTKSDTFLLLTNFFKHEKKFILVVNSCNSYDDCLR